MMKQSIYFGRNLLPVIEGGVIYPYGTGSYRNTFTDWNIVASACPVFAPPKQKTSYIDIPGGNGALDLSEALTGFPVYENRIGTVDFSVINDNRPWAGRYSEIMGFLHGKKVMAILDDDPNWFYRGRFSVDTWSPGNPFNLIQIGYILEPYKWSVYTTVEDWVWDPFDFEFGVLWQDTVSNIIVDTEEAVWVRHTFGNVVDNGEYFFGSAPVSPRFKVTGANNLQARFTNEILGIYKTVSLENGDDNYIDEFIFYGAKDSDYILEFTGQGTIDIEFRVGRL